MSKLNVGVIDYTSGVAIKSQAVNTQTGTTYTFVESDAGKLVSASNGSAVTFTIPPQSSVTWGSNAVLKVVNYGAGALTIDGGSGVTVTNTATPVAQYSSAAAIRTAEDAWTLVPFSGGLFSATGGAEVVTVSGFKYHVFTATGSFIASQEGFVQVLAVGGGAGGGSQTAGGGGGGGSIQSFQTIKVNSGVNAVTVGAGGAGGLQGVSTKGGQGGNSVFAGSTSLTALGGGGGASAGTGGGAASTGGSGGGGTYNNTSGAAGTGPNTFAGGNASNSPPCFGAGGGGGATAVGGNGSSTVGGNGGAGKTVTDFDTNLTAANFPTTLTGYPTKRFSAGGGGGSYAGTAGTGGTGGGANGSNSGTITPTTATSYGSGGGGGGRTGGTLGNGGAGHSGIVIVRYFN